MIVYKYLPPARVNVLSGGQIRFTQIEALNDPFESTPLTELLRMSLAARGIDSLINSKDKTFVHDNIVRYRINRMARKAVKGIVGETRSNKGILSVSLERSQPLMWSHYCDSHRGFVVGFDGLHDYFQKGIQGKRGGLRNIIYSQTRPSFPSFDDFSNHNPAEILLYYKSTHWSYERELRMLHNLEHADCNKNIDPNGHRVYLFNFPVETVREVILGCQMPALLRNEVISLVREKYPNAKLYQAEMSKTEFNLVIKEI